MAEKVQMIFEQQLKDRCTPNAIKFMVELAKGFEWDDEGFKSIQKDKEETKKIKGLI